MTLNDTLKGLVDTVDGALGCAVVDVSSGLMLGVYHTVPYFTQSYVDAVAAAAVEMFRGNTVRAVEKLLATQRGDSEVNYIKEVQMTTDNTLHFMCIVPNKPNALVVLITNKQANLGMGWAALRRSLDEVAPHCP
ncbi:MAG: hypothetical protein Q9N67_08270 [Ghiorsea sp.]|nr:hypothetical protein [Ghiorsea sp.]